MKTLKKVIVVLLNLVLINLITILAVSMNLQTIVKDNIIKETIKEELFNKETSPISAEIVAPNEKLNELFESPEVQGLIDKYLDITIDSLTEDKDISEITIEEDMLNYLKSNKEEVEDKLGIKVTDEMLSKVEEQLESKEASKIFSQNLNNVKNNMSQEATTVLAVYNYLNSLKFKLLISFFIIIDLVLIASLQKSLYKWLSSLGYSSIISGIGILLMSIIVKLVVTNVSNLRYFNLRTLTLTGIILLIVGIVLAIMKRVIDKKLVKEDDYEVSKISNKEC